jgi:hypothetical protein
VTSYRSAGTADAHAIAEVHVRTWQVAYRGQVPDDYLDGLSVDERAERWGQALAELEAPAAVLVAEDGGAIVGFASIMASRDEDAEPETGELAAIYLSPGHWARGSAPSCSGGPSEVSERRASSPPRSGCSRATPGPAGATKPGAGHPTAPSR